MVCLTILWNTPSIRTPVPLRGREKSEDNIRVVSHSRHGLAGEALRIPFPVPFTRLDAFLGQRPVVVDHMRTTHRLL